MTVMEELLSTVAVVFEERQEIKATTEELGLAELKVRKLLITSGKLLVAFHLQKSFLLL